MTQYVRCKQTFEMLLSLLGNSPLSQTLLIIMAQKLQNRSKNVLNQSKDIQNESKNI